MSQTRRKAKHAVSLFGPWGIVALTLAVAMGCAITVGTDAAGVPRPIGFLAGLFVGVLSIGALPSFSKRAVVVAVLGLGGFVMVRQLQVVGSADGALVIGFVMGTLASIVVSERIVASEGVQLRTGVVSPWTGLGRSSPALIVALLVVATIAAPLVSKAMHQDVRSGSSGNPFTDPSSTELLSVTGQMDTHVRPRLSNKVVMTVDADRAAFWRGTTFDRWDGQSWTRSSTPHGSPLSPDREGWNDVSPSPEDPALDQGVFNRQTFTLRAPYSQMLYSAASTVRVRSDRYVGQLADGTLFVEPQEALGSGTSYTVESRMPHATSAALQAAPTGPLLGNVQRNDLDPGIVSQRVQQLADDITHSAPTNYDKVQAIIAWLSAHTKYSLNAPLPPSEDHDAVDYFLFQSHEGWCEQISSALTVMLRAEKIPARVATGFATGEADRVTGRFTVREKDAHAWTEVYFPTIGWQGFDPTAAVPFAGDPPPSKTIFDWLKDHALGAIAVVIFACGLVVGVPWLIRSGRRRTPRRTPSWAATALRDLERLGKQHDRPRAANESPAAYGRALGDHLVRPDLVDVGASIDAAAFGRDAPPLL